MSYDHVEKVSALRRALPIDASRNATPRFLLRETTWSSERCAEGCAAALCLVSLRAQQRAVLLWVCSVVVSANEASRRLLSMSTWARGLDATERFQRESLTGNYRKI